MEAAVSLGVCPSALESGVIYLQFLYGIDQFFAPFFKLPRSNPLKRNLIVSVLAILSCVSAFGQLPVFNHVFVVVEENHNYASVIGNTSMPYLNSLATKYGLATQYYANTHPSIGDYFELTTGQTITNNDSYNQKVTADNVVRHLLTAGKTWKAYEESLPKVGYISPDTGKYARRHCPLSYLSDVIDTVVRITAQVGSNNE